MKKADIRQIYKELHVPLHIQKHMAKVGEVAIQLAKAYKNIGIKVDENTLQAAALLHDALKICNIRDLSRGHFQQKISEEDLRKWAVLKTKYPDKSDAKSMAKFMRAKKERQIANLIEKHDFACVLRDLKTLEEKLLYYADKRVKHDKVVSLKERLRDGRERYAPTQKQLEKIASIEKAIYSLEEELFKPLTITPEDVT